MQKVLKNHFLPFFGTSLLAGSILTILAPYNTMQMSFFPRAVYWIGLCAAGGLGAGTVAFVCRKRSIQLNPFIMTLWQSVGATLYVSLFLIIGNYFMTGYISLINITITVFYVWIISITLCAIGNLVNHRQTSSINLPERAALFERLKPHLRSADIYALSAEDHYVRVHTSKGEDLILMRLSDAINEISPLPGLSTHRSWWVAEAGVKSVTRKDGKTSIILHSGMDVPVSRGRTKDLKQSGWV